MIIIKNNFGFQNFRGTPVKNQWFRRYSNIFGANLYKNVELN